VRIARHPLWHQPAEPAGSLGGPHNNLSGDARLDTAPSYAESTTSNRLFVGVRRDSRLSFVLPTFGYAGAIVQPRFRSFFCDPIERRSALRPAALLISTKILEVDAPVAADLVARQFSAFQRLDEMGQGNPEEVGGALRGLLLIFGNQDNRPAQLHVAHDVF
jgi:hypothetical protein